MRILAGTPSSARQVLVSPPSLIKIRVQLQGSFQMLGSLRELPVSLQHDCRIVVEVWAVGGDSHSFQEFVNRLVVSSLISQSRSKITVRLGVAGLEAHGLRILGDGFAEVGTLNGTTRRALTNPIHLL